MKQTKEQFFCAATLLAAWVLFHYRILFLGHAEVLLDASRFFYPLWTWGAGVWKQGLIPLWNPDAAFGTPYLADPDMAAWYPPLALAYSFFSSATAFSFLTVAHHLWALLGFFLFARNRGFSPLVALGGCLVFGFSFNAVSLAWITAILFAFSWIPWVFLAADRVREGKAGSFLLLLTVFAMQMAAGYPLYAYLTGLAVTGDWFFRWWFSEKRTSRIRVWVPRMTWGPLAVGLAAAYNAAWLFPLKEMIPYSNLSSRLDMSQGVAWSELATWLNPFFHGHPLFSHPDTPFSYTVYFAGLPTLVLILWGLIRMKISKGSLSLFFVILVLSLGQSAYLGTLLKYFLPGYSLVVRSGYWISLVVFMSAILSMEALAAFIREKSINPTLWAVLTGFIYFWALWLGIPWDLGTFWVSFLCLVAAGIGFSSSLPTYQRSLLVLLSLAFSLGPVVRGIHFTMERSYYDKPKILETMLLPGRIYHSPKTVDSFQTIAGKSVADGYEKQKEALIPNLPLAYGREEVSFSNPLFLRSFFDAYLSSETWSTKLLLNYFGAKYLAENKNGIQVIENKEAFPKWFSVKEAVSEYPPEGSDFYIWSLVNVGDLKTKCAIADGHEFGKYDLRQVQETFRTPSGIGLKAIGPGRALLVSSETAYPGWVAKVNGSRHPIEVVNGGFRGLILNDGEEEVSLSYRPTSFKLGCFLSLLACGIWAGLVLRWGFRSFYA